MRRVIRLVVTMSVLPFVHPAAQQLGQRIRALSTADTPARWIVGDLVSEAGDSLQFQVAGQGQPVSVARRSLKRVEVSLGRKRAVLDGAKLGFGLGFMLGALSQVYRHPQSCDGSGNGLCPFDWEAHVVEGGLIGGAVAGLVGAALGYAVTTERWEGLPVGRARVAVAPNGTGLGLSIAF